ncbi:hypothetical protein DFH09DRAFT_909501 [Mycena vulgaris]|nr:hypothetical protein DFH09DRAFT_909501 [Mycena vulgaris]
MARGRRKPTQSKNELQKPECQWCKQHRDARRFDKHQIFCRTNYLLRRKERHPARHGSPGEERADSDVEMEAQSLPRSSPSPHPMDLDPPFSPGSPEAEEKILGPLLPGAYFKIIPHPHSTDPTPLIVPLGSSFDRDTLNSTATDNFGHKPWFPFRTRADFEVAEIVVKGALNQKLTNQLLHGVTDDWGTGRSRVTIQNSDEMQRTLASARRYGVTAKTHEVKFEYRDPWDWITTLLDDVTLGSTTMYNSVRTFWCMCRPGNIYCCPFGNGFDLVAHGVLAVHRLGASLRAGLGRGARWRGGA